MNNERSQKKGGGLFVKNNAIQHHARKRNIVRQFCRAIPVVEYTRRKTES